MSAREIIEQIKALPREEQSQVYNYLSQERSDQSLGVKVASHEEFKRAADSVFAKHSDLPRMLSQ